MKKQTELKSAYLGLAIKESLRCRLRKLAAKEERSLNSLIGILLDEGCSKRERSRRA